MMGKGISGNLAQNDLSGAALAFRLVSNPLDLLDRINGAVYCPVRWTVRTIRIRQRIQPIRLGHSHPRSLLPNPASDSQALWPLHHFRNLPVHKLPAGPREIQFRFWYSSTNFADILSSR
jgi:hypothetical protein